MYCGYTEPNKHLPKNEFELEKKKAIQSATDQAFDCFDFIGMNKPTVSRFIVFNFTENEIWNQLNEFEIKKERKMINRKIKKKQRRPRRKFSEIEEQRRLAEERKQFK